MMFPDGGHKIETELRLNQKQSVVVRPIDEQLLIVFLINLRSISQSRS